jgi:alpha-tubulin suppressor-like RCC1 family protein
MKKNLLLLFVAVITLSVANAQTQTTTPCTPDPNGCTDYSNAFLNSSSPNTLEYDNVASGYHSTNARRYDGTWLVWGENMAAVKNTNVLSPQVINAVNYPGLTGTVLKCTQGGSGVAQAIVLTTTGLFSWGQDNSILSTTIASANVFQKITVNAKSDGLPATVSPSQVKMMFGTYETLAIVTCSGDGWVLTQTQGNQGDGAASNKIIWHHVLTAAATPLAGIVAIRGCQNTMMALTTTGAVYTWGANAFLGNNTAVSTTTVFATQMTLPLGITPKMIGMTEGNGSSDSYYLLATNNNLYSLGNNGFQQLGDFTTITRTSWVQPLVSAGGAFLTNIAWVSPAEHDPSNASVNALTTSGTLYAWGVNSSQMLGGGASNMVNPISQPGGLAATDKIIAVETGGHTSMIWKQCVNNFAFVGHRINGSAGDGSASTSVVSNYDFTSAQNTFSVCGANLAPTVSFASASGVICQGSSATLTGAPTGGTFSILSANASIAGSTLNITAGSVDTVKIKYIGPVGCTALDTINILQNDYGNLNTGTWPVASATVLTAARSVWLGTTAANTDCGTNTSDGADGFSITGGGVTGSGTQASPWQIIGGTSTIPYTFNVTVNGTTGTAPNPVYWAVWYDVNGNGNFTDAQDFFQTGSTLHGSPVTTSFSVTVPLTGTAFGASSGVIRVAATAVDPTFTQAMNGSVALSNGEIEDYYVIYLIPLPVTLSNFTVAKINGHALLNWSTSSEENTQSFIIEHSTNGNDYTQIGKAAAEGNSSEVENYSFTDNDPAAGTNYYRLRMVDKDGRFTYSEIRVLNFDGAITIVVYPNPTEDMLTITGVEAGMQLRLIAVDGRVLSTQLAKGNTEIMHVRQFASGIYIVQAIKNGAVLNAVKFSKK